MVHKNIVHKSMSIKTLARLKLGFIEQGGIISAKWLKNKSLLTPMNRSEKLSKDNRQIIIRVCPKAPTGILGLDEITGGGLPAGRKG